MHRILTYAAAAAAFCTVAAWLLYAPMVLVRAGAVVTAAIALVGIVAERGGR